jgi:prefoldin subunit 5
MKMRSLHTVTLGLTVVMALSLGCAADQLQRFQDTMEVALETTQKALDTVERGAKKVQCIKDNTCPAQQQ